MTTSLYQNRVVRIHSILADGGKGLDGRGYNAIKLWYWVRSLDIRGSGQVDFCISQAETELGCSKLTIKRYLENGLALGLFRSVERCHGRVKLYYSSLANVCIRQGLYGWGAVAEVPVSDLKNLRVVATELQAFSLQAASVYLAKLSVPRGLRSNVVKPEDVLQKASHCSRGANVVHVGKRCLFLSEDAIAVGVSQSRLAKSLGRCDRTIRRRLSNEWRASRGIPAIFKRQLAQTKPEFDSVGFAIAERCHNPVSKFFSCKGRTWKGGCNVYYPDLTLTSNKAARYFYNRKLQLILNTGTDTGNV